MSRYRSRQRSRGQALAEFAIVLPVLVLVIFGLFDAGRGVIFFTELSNASRAGARIAIVNQSNDASCVGSDTTFKCAAANVAVGTGISPATIPDLTISGSDCARPSNCTATVTVDYTFKLATPIIDGLWGDIAMSASTTMPLERTYTSPANP